MPQATTALKHTYNQAVFPHTQREIPLLHTSLKTFSFCAVPGGHEEQFGFFIRLYSSCLHGKITAMSPQISRLNSSIIPPFSQKRHFVESSYHLSHFSPIL